MVDAALVGFDIPWLQDVEQWEGFAVAPGDGVEFTARASRLALSRMRAGNP